jgi:hypothetical protein
MSGSGQLSRLSFGSRSAYLDRTRKFRTGSLAIRSIGGNARIAMHCLPSRAVKFKIDGYSARWRARRALRLPWFSAPAACKIGEFCS